MADKVAAPVSWYERFLRYLQDHQHQTSFIVSVVFFVLGVLYTLKDYTSFKPFCADLALNAMVALATFFMCELFMTTLEFRKDLQSAKERLPAQVADEITKATSAIVDTSVALASPHLRAHLVDYPEKWLRRFGEIQPSQPGKSRAVAAVREARRGIACKVFCLDVNRYADVADVLLEGANHTVESTTYFPNHEFVDELKNKTSEVRDWIKNVNDWAAKDASRRVVRVHLLEPDRDARRACNGADEACLHLRSASQFVQLLSAESDAEEFYVQKYAFPPGLEGRLTFHACELPERNREPPPLPPECIVLDRQVAVMYDPRFRQLRLFFGPIAEQMGAAFDEVDFASIRSKAMTDYLDTKKVTA